MSTKKYTIVLPEIRLGIKDSDYKSTPEFNKTLDEIKCE